MAVECVEITTDELLRWIYKAIQAANTWARLR